METLEEVTCRSAPAITAGALTKKYGDVTVLDSVDLELDRGNRVAVVGPNGSGKTTLIHILSGLLRPTAGEILLHHDAARPGAVAIAPDDLALPESLTGRELVALTTRLRRTAAVLDPEVLADELDLGPALDRPVSQYSHGMRRKIQLLCAVMHAPDVLFLDEPHRGLDPNSSIVLRTLIDSVAAQGACVVSATHTLGITSRDYDHLVVMATGRVLASGPIDTLLEEHRVSTVEELFLRLTGAWSSIGATQSRLRDLMSRSYDRRSTS